MASTKRKTSKQASSRKKAAGPPSAAKRIRKVAQEKFGFEILRPGQEEAISALLDGSDCLVVMPTGFGKSAIYQIAGSMIEGATLVISPLIALQKDQVESINEQTDDEAAVLNSTLRAAEHGKCLRRSRKARANSSFLRPNSYENEKQSSCSRTQACLCLS